jgi:putative SOS response-associated peptidase YedK
MCGRYGFGNPARLHELKLGVTLPELGPRFNVAPTQPVPMVLTTRGGNREATMARWGLVPFWADDPKIGSRMINARGDSVRTKPAFREAFSRRRALMPADLFYEWQAIPGTKVKQPWCIRMPGDAPFAFAAIWERWKPRGDHTAEWLISCAVITTEPNAVMQPIHDRMPVIIPPEHYDEWLDPLTLEDTAYNMIRPYEGDMRAYQIGTYVNAPARDDVGCIASMSDP